jgi:hypothetical protein
MPGAGKDFRSPHQALALVTRILEWVEVGDFMMTGCYDQSSLIPGERRASE